MPSWQTGPTPLVRSARRCAHAASRPSSPSDATRRTTDADGSARADVLRGSIGRTTSAVTSSSVPFALLKQWRGLATRFDKLAIVYRSAVVLAEVLVWARN